MNKKGVALVVVLVALVAGIALSLLRRPAPLVIERVSDSPSYSETNSQVPTAPVTPASTDAPATAHDREQASLFDQVIASKNDNDPRFDTDLRVLAPGARALLRERYANFAPEKRNERGTTVFLLGRNLETPEDFEFMGQVLSEAPCRSLESCDRDSPAETRENAHHDIGVEVTLAYPQIVALKSLERVLSTPGADPALVSQAMAKIRAARDSKVRRVSEMAESLLRRGP